MTGQPAQLAHTAFTAEATGGLGEIDILHPPGTFALTPASLIGIDAIIAHQNLLAGLGLDWGCGSGCLGILAARIAEVDRVYGLDIVPANIEIARQNAARNGVAAKTRFMLADSYLPFSETDRHDLAAQAGNFDFILANPPSSDGDDGFQFRRVVLEGAKGFLRRNGILFLNISYQYGAERVRRLWSDTTGLKYEGVLASTDWVPFDLNRPDLLQSAQDYAAEEQRGGWPYAFHHPTQPDLEIAARAALDIFRREGSSPLSKWQVHLFRYIGD
ncbi:MAG: methyltransferase [Caldilineales bacterium]|nr:methyltransferase [Caldilineales bacterium]